jgi:hypothetical protein
VRKLLILCAILVVFSVQLFARNHDWNKVEKLKPGTLLEIELWKGPVVVGRLELATDSSVRLKLWYGTAMEEISRNLVRRVIRVPRTHAPDPHKLLVAGAVVGGVAGATAVSVSDHHDCQGCKGFRIVMGGAAGAGLGFMGAAMIGAGIEVADLLHHSKVIYVGDRPPGEVRSITPSSLVGSD